MSDIHVRQPHSLDLEAIKGQLSGFADFLGKYGVSMSWLDERKAEVKGMGVGGSIAVEDDAVDVKVSLGMMAKMAGVDAGKLQASIEKRLAQAIEAAGG